MKKYCFDTSGLSNPLETMPEDIHESMWKRVRALIVAGHIAVTQEIYDEMIHIGGTVGKCIVGHKKLVLLEVNSNSWNWQLYVDHAAAMQAAHHKYISEYNGGSPKTVCLNDISIIALAKALKLPVVGMESYVTVASSNKRRIPNICKAEDVEHLTFSDFLRRETIRV